MQQQALEQRSEQNATGATPHLRSGKLIASVSDADVIALSTLRVCGLNAAEIAQAWQIHKWEGGWNSISKSGCYGGWQIKLGGKGAHAGITQAEAFDPAWSTRYAVGYMRGRYGSIAAAYAFHIRHGWY